MRARSGVVGPMVLVVVDERGVGLEFHIDLGRRCFRSRSPPSIWW